MPKNGVSNDNLCILNAKFVYEIDPGVVYLLTLYLIDKLSVNNEIVCKRCF